jgi:hypothetical protein
LIGHALFNVSAKGVAVGVTGVIANKEATFSNVGFLGFKKMTGHVHVLAFEMVGDRVFDVTEVLCRFDGEEEGDVSAIVVENFKLEDVLSGGFGFGVFGQFEFVTILGTDDETLHLQHSSMMHLSQDCQAESTIISRLNNFWFRL